MRTTRPPVVDGLSLALQAASPTTAKLQASYAIVPDFFNGLLASACASSALYRRTIVAGAR
jgi:hypothetical protein